MAKTADEILAKYGVKRSTALTKTGSNTDSILAKYGVKRSTGLPKTYYATAGERENSVFGQMLDDAKAAAREEAKSGVMPEEVEALCREILRMPWLRLCGFMTMGPRLEDDSAYVSYFRSVKEIGDGVWRALALSGEPLYSMGMSESFGAAIAAGAHMVRVGRRLFYKSNT